METPTAALANLLLSSLARDQFDLLSPFMTSEFFDHGAVLIETGDEIDTVYFPHNGMLSLLSVLTDGRTVETGMVGREGAVGLIAGLGLRRSRVRVVVAVPLELTKIPASRFRKVVAGADAIRDLCVVSNETLLSHARVIAACNALHLIEARFCRWLLQTADRAASDTVELTQEYVAEMLGVRRTSVTEVANKVQASGVISYSRGLIKILDRPALEQLSCECYATLRYEAADRR